MQLTVSKDLISGNANGLMDILSEILAEGQKMTILTGGIKHLSWVKMALVKQRPDWPVLDLYLPSNAEDGQISQKFSAYLLNGFTGIVMVAYGDSAKEVIKIDSLEDCITSGLPKHLKEALISAMGQQQPDSATETGYFAKPAKNHHEKMVLKTNEMIQATNINDIIIAKSDNNYTSFYLTDGSDIMVTQPLKSFEKKLMPYGFMRVHQSYLVNLNHIKSFLKRSGQLVLTNNDKVPVSKTKKIDLLNYLNNFMF